MRDLCRGADRLLGYLVLETTGDVCRPQELTRQVRGDRVLDSQILLNGSEGTVFKERRTALLAIQRTLGTEGHAGRTFDVVRLRYYGHRDALARL